MTRSKHLLAAAVLAAVSLSGLSVAHASVSLDPTAPQVASATFQQWKSIAAREAASVAAQLDPASGPWRVQLVAEDRSFFEDTFKNMLVSELHARGVKLTDDASAPSIDIRVDVKVLPSERAKYEAGTISVLTAGVWVVHAITSSMPAAGAATVLALGADALLSNLPERGDKPVAELAITLQAARDGQIKARQTNVYLASDLNAADYAHNTSSTLSFKR
jgi:hypothetical protein